MPILVEHIWDLGTLPLLHKDPFDRLLAAQARYEKAVLVTTDPQLLRYPVDHLAADGSIVNGLEE